MFVLKTTVEGEQFLSELPCKIKNLRSRSSFVFFNCSCEKVYIWHGCLANENMQKYSKNLAEKLIKMKCEELGFVSDSKTSISLELFEIKEGQECSSFMMIFNSGTIERSPKRSNTNSRSNLNRELYNSLDDDKKDYRFTPRMFHFVSDSNSFMVKEIIPAWAPKHDSNVILDYPFDQMDIYERAKCRPTFFLIDNGSDVYLWESKFPFYLPTNNDKKDCEAEQKSGNRKLVDVEGEILDEAQATTGSAAQRWLAERKCALETTLAYCHGLWLFCFVFVLFFNVNLSFYNSQK